MYILSELCSGNYDRRRSAKCQKLIPDSEDIGYLNLVKCKIRLVKADEQHNPQDCNVACLGTCFGKPCTKDGDARAAQSVQQYPNFLGSTSLCTVYVRAERDCSLINLTFFESP
jgi:hypothetical protein